MTAAGEDVDIEKMVAFSEATKIEGWLEKRMSLKDSTLVALQNNLIICRKIFSIEICKSPMSL